MQIFYVYQWNKIQNNSSNLDDNNLTVAIIIPARNEENNIANLLHSISLQNYPASLIEIILVDDFSDDNTTKIAESILQNLQFSYKILYLKDYKYNAAHKKNAIEYAISQTNQEIIITTDADCIVKPNWVTEIVKYFSSTDANLIASPVLLSDNEKINVWKRFECLDFCGMQLITGATLNAKIFNMANGANLAYKRSAFVACDGYTNINQKASGDDMLLVYKIAQLDKNKMYFLKNYDAITQTKPTQNIKAFLHQRFRWTSKATDYQDKRVTLMLALVLFFCFSIVINFLLAIAYPIYYSISPNKSLEGLIEFLNVLIFGVLFIIQITLKTIADYYLLHKATHFFKSNHLKKYFIISEYLHILYIVFVGTLGNFIHADWKGRKIK